ncbi:hypothetical protein O3M35_000164 [Rhynocoris fuscipes]|uniref:Phosphorylated adapter RNA export protein n=1 Tax=Rhynocoris fuscipes TaxID=488301 RepID=A0AAW1DP79_9HEMI
MDMQLEEGEISDGSDDDNINPYIPLERPGAHFEPIKGFDSDNPAMDMDATSSKQRKPPGLQSSSDSDSDDEETNVKRLKVSSPIKNKYNIWNKDPDGDLTDILNQVGMDEMPDPENSRNVENYPLPFKRSDNRNGKFLRARRRKIPQKALGKDGELAKKFARILDCLEVNETNSFEEVAEDITKKLKERNQELILKIVIVLGKEKAIQVYEKTRLIEKMGGMLINNGSRKRTSGGVFIFLVRSDKEISDDKLMAIFESDDQQQKDVCKLLNSLKKRRRRKKGSKHNAEKSSSELSNPPPSPDLPQQFPTDQPLDFLL